MRPSPPPNILVTEPLGTGTSSLGSFTSSESHCLNVATGNFFNGLFTFDFGGGNTFFGTYVETIALPLPPPTGVAAVSFSYTLTGGTGLYAGATGSLMASGATTFTPTGRNSHIDINGTISTIPEPATMVLLGSGLAGVGAAVRKRRKSHRDQAG